MFTTIVLHTTNDIRLYILISFDLLVFILFYKVFKLLIISSL